MSRKTVIAQAWSSIVTADLFDAASVPSPSCRSVAVLPKDFTRSVCCVTSPSFLARQLATDVKAFAEMFDRRPALSDHQEHVPDPV